MDTVSILFLGQILSTIEQHALGAVLLLLLLLAYAVARWVSRKE